MSETTAPVVVMQRFELKYLLSAEQTAYLKKELEGHMLLDRYGRISIASIRLPSVIIVPAGCAP